MPTRPDRGRAAKPRRSKSPKTGPDTVKPPGNAKGKIKETYFGGMPKSSFRDADPTDPIAMQQIFLHYVMTVWCNGPGVPTTADDLSRFDLDGLQDAYQEFLAKGGVIPERGVTIQELVLGTQLGLRKPLECLLNVGRPKPRTDRITRLRVMPAKEICRTLDMIYEDPFLERWSPDLDLRRCLLQAALTDGVMAHVVTVISVGDGEVQYRDPWPGDSLFCKANNRAGVAAVPSEIFQGCWKMTMPEFERVVFAILLDSDAPCFGRIPLTPQERKAAVARRAMMGMLRGLNRQNSSKRAAPRPFEGMKWVSRLEAAAATGRLWELKVALNEGDDVNSRSESGTALHCAARAGHLPIVRLLVEQGANLSALDGEGKTAAQVAVENKRTGVAAFLKQAAKAPR